MIPRSLAAVALALALAGCEGEPKFDATASYSPESLAKEFVFLYKDLDKSAPAAVPATPGKEAAAKKAAGPATKKAAVSALPGLLDETIAKANTIPGMSHAEARSKLAGLLANDPSISETDKKTIADRLAAAKD